MLDNLGIQISNTRACLVTFDIHCQTSTNRTNGVLLILIELCRWRVDGVVCYLNIFFVGLRIRVLFSTMGSHWLVEKLWAFACQGLWRV